MHETTDETLDEPERAMRIRRATLWQRTRSRVAQAVTWGTLPASSRRLRSRRALMVAVLLVAGLTVPATAASTPAEGPTTRQPVSADQLTGRDRAALAGRMAKMPVGSPITVYADPPLDALGDLIPGDSVAAPVVGVGRVGAGGEFRLDLDVKDGTLSRRTDDVDLTVVGHGEGRVAVAGLTLKRGKGGSLRGQDLGVVNSDTAAPDEAEERIDDVTFEDPAEIEELQCHVQFIETIPDRPTTAIVIGSNTAYVKFSARYTQGGKTTMGFATTASGRWAKASGSYTRTASSGFEAYWGTSKFSDSTATYSLRITTDYRKYKRICPTGTWYEVKPHRIVGSKWPVKWGSNQFYTHCRSLGSAQTMSRGNGTTWSNGVTLGSDAGNIKVSADTDFRWETRIHMDPKISGRYWCGRTGVPTGDNPGAVMGDHKNRGA